MAYQARPGEWAGGGGNRPGGGQPQRQVVQMPSSSEIGALAIRGVTAFAKRNKVVSFSWLWGFVVLLLIGSGTKLSVDQAKRYNHIMSTIDLDAEFAASNRYAIASQNYHATKGWFSCDALCQRNRAHMDQAKAQLDDIRAEGYARMSDAKKVAGLWSEVGVGEVKDSFWRYFTQGKQFAKRQSMWDLMFLGFRRMGRDESMVEFALKMLIQVLINFSMGLIAAFFIFVFGLWSIVKSYQPNPVTAVIYFVSAACAAFAFVSTYLLMLYGAAAGSVYGAAKLAESQRRLENGGRGYGQQQRVQYGYGGRNRPQYGYGGNRPHYQ